MARTVSVVPSDPLSMMRKLAETRRAQARKLDQEATALEELVARLSTAAPGGTPPPPGKGSR